MTDKDKFKVGDFVKWIDEPIKGKITAFNEPYFTVLLEDGFTVTCLGTDIILDKTFDISISDHYDHSLKDRKQSKSQSKKNKPLNFLEVDLHLHQLIDNENQLTNHDKLNLQMRTVKNKIDVARKNNISKIIFIHGIGKGVLRNTLHKYLNDHKFIFHEASYQKYGQGATEVLLF